jgi:hypothetical protein
MPGCRERIPEGAAVLDLMNSCVSHLPPEKQYSRIVGHGMNAEELAKNKQLDDFFVRNLNTEPSGWSLGDQSMDAVLICVRCASASYLTFTSGSCAANCTAAAASRKHACG